VIMQDAATDRRL